jgi:S-adenosylmethionine:tRNA-ribosyltransferase-isomerase (queuine synthetase)
VKLSRISKIIFAAITTIAILFEPALAAKPLVGAWNNSHYQKINHLHADGSVSAPTAGRGWDQGSWRHNSNGTLTIQFPNGSINLRPISRDHMVEIGNNHNWYRVTDEQPPANDHAIVGSWNNVHYQTINHLRADGSVSAPTAGQGWDQGSWKINKDGTVTLRFASGSIALKPIDSRLMKEINTNHDWVRVR